MRFIQRLIAISLVLTFTFGAAGCSRLQISREIASVNDRVITEAEFKYYLESVKSQMLQEAGEQSVEDFWETAEIDGEKAADVAKKKALEELIRVEIAVIKAEERDLSVTDDVLKQIDSLLKSTNSQQKAQVDEIKKTTGLHNELFRKVFEKSALASQLKTDISVNETESLEVSDEEIFEEYDKQYVRVKHVLIASQQEEPVMEDPTQADDEEDEEISQTPEATEEPISAEDYKALKKELAEEVLVKAKSGTDFDSLVAEYGEDPGMEGAPDGYTFTKGAMMPEFETASFALPVGQISDLVETSYGFHIIKRYELLTSGEEYDSNIQSIRSVAEESKYNKLLDSWKGDFQIEIKQGIIDRIKVK